MAPLVTADLMHQSEIHQDQLAFLCPVEVARMHVSMAQTLDEVHQVLQVIDPLSELEGRKVERMVLVG